MSIVPDAQLSALDQLTAADADALDFGVIRLDDEGVVTLYNAWEARMAKVLPEAALGRNFFQEIAPCTDNALFEGRFTAGVQAGELDVTLDYVFSYRMDPLSVKVRMYRHSASGTNWIFVQRAI